MATILLVDDDPDGREILACILRSGAHTVIEAAGGTDALDVLDRAEDLDLLLTDVVMPGLSGFNLARMVRMRRPALRILYVTAFADQVLTMRDAGEKYGKLLMKPIHADELLKEVDTALAAKPG
jgi:CheY-like chemotaxis protein